MLERHYKPRENSPVSSSVWEGWIWLLLLAFAVRVVGLDAQGMWRDEVDQWRFALQSWDTLLENFTRPGWNGPLFQVLLRGWITLAGESTYALRYFSLLWGVVGVALVYALGRRLLGARGAAWSALMAATAPYLVWYAQEVKMYTWWPVLALVILYAADCALARRRWAGLIVAVVALGLAVYSHILAPLIVPVALIWGLTHMRRDWRVIVGMAALLLVIGLISLPLLRWQAPLLLQQRETGFPSYTLRQMIEILFSGWSSGMWANLTLPSMPIWQRTLLALFGGLALVGLIDLLRRKRVRVLVRLLTWMSVPLLMLWGISQLYGPLFTDRYLIWCAPAFCFLIGAGCARLQKFAPRWITPLLLLLVLGANGRVLVAQATHPIKPEFDEVSRYLAEHREPDELLLFQIPYNHYVMDYYLTAPLNPWAAAPFSNWRLPSGEYKVDDVDKEMARLTEGHDEVWLIYSEVLLWDERELVKAWLDAHGEATAAQHYHRVSLYHYRLPK
ncbi:MAG: hypothetical protein GVY30_05215 [Chloroflexi bacterium]|nr:hypothetical protein [Chloroflexota bacterium]